MSNSVQKIARVPEVVRGHKLYAPAPLVGAIERKDLLDRIFERPDLRIVVLQAPAGHGKSTLLQQVFARCEANGEFNGWLTLDEADNDIRRLQRHLDDMLRGIESEGTSRPKGEGEVAEEGDTLRHHSDLFLDRLVQHAQPINLFFDEFQQLADKRILSFFRRVIEQIPINCRLFIGSRSMPEVGLARLAAHGRALLLTPEDLRFTSPETRQFFCAARDVGINADEVEAIHRHAEGWPAALQLFRLSLPNPQVRHFLGNLDAFRLPEIAEYLADSVFAQQNPRVQDFLLRTSLLANLSEPLCDAVLGRKGSGDVLRGLEANGLFTRRVDASRTWFRYHSIFSAFLQAHLRTTHPEAIEEVHRRALRWYTENGFLDEALHHAVSLHDYETAATLLDAWSSQLITGGYLATVERWTDRIPITAMEMRPDLAVKTAWALVFLRRHAKYPQVLDLIRRQVDRGLRPKDSEPQIVSAMAAVLDDDLSRSFRMIASVDVNRPGVVGFQAFELGAAANLLSFQASIEARFEDSRAYLVAARGLSKRVSALFSLGYAVSIGGMNLLQHGRLDAALNHLRQGMVEPGLSAEGSYSAAALVSIYCLALYEAGALDEAEAQFTAYRYMLADATPVDFRAAAYITMSRIHDARNCPEQAAIILEEMEEIGFSAELPRLVQIVGWERVRRACISGELELAVSHMKRIAAPSPGWQLPANGLAFSDDTEGEAIGRIRLATAAGNAAEALSMISAEIAQSRRLGRNRRTMKLRVLEAAAHATAGHLVAAQRALTQGLASAEPGGFVRLFLDEGQVVISLLRDLAISLRDSGAAEPSVGFVTRMLSASGTGLLLHHGHKVLRPVEPLTERELEILRLLAVGVSNREMAERVFISENTIKFHLKNIYSKLAVQGRIQAITAAHDMGII